VVQGFDCYPHRTNRALSGRKYSPTKQSVRNFPNDRQITQLRAAGLMATTLAPQ
jgi:hypothetical protein